jgi:hypothetical protein
VHEPADEVSAVAEDDERPRMLFYLPLVLKRAQRER